MGLLRWNNAWQAGAILASYYVLTITLGSYFLSPGSSPGIDPPWYFIQRDFIALPPSLLGLLLVCYLVYRARLAHEKNNGMIIMVAVLLWLDVWRGLVILIRCGPVFDPLVATPYWQTHDSYLYDPWILGGKILSLVAFFALALRWRRASRR